MAPEETAGGDKPAEEVGGTVEGIGESRAFRDLTAGAHRLQDHGEMPLRGFRPGGGQDRLASPERHRTRAGNGPAGRWPVRVCKPFAAPLRSTWSPMGMPGRMRSRAGGWAG
ncbi:hypothetical protein GCM10017779_70470 [Streptomyces capillispiralis]|nr:hypothetical protein GCM10017779_70470 [Streptomyces capillispiralis]